MARRLTERPRRGVRIVTVVALLGAGGLAAGCSNTDALTLVRQACGHVQRSIDLYRTAASAPTPAAQQAGQAAALAQLRLALPLAASAAGESAQWQAFMTTLEESSRVPESVLVDALQQQCADVAAGAQPGPPSTTLPPTAP